jgi:hypothetical protein
MSTKHLIPNSHPISGLQSSDSWSSRLKFPSPDIACLLRILHLSLLTSIFRWDDGAERKKVAIYKHKPTAVLQSILHWAPVAASVLLITWNAKGWIASSEMNTIVSNSLQFVAKVFELAMQASLGAIVLAIVRHHVIYTGQLPFGLFMASTKAADVSYLWSIELWGGLAATWPKKWQSKILLASLPFLVALASVVGPSGAILLIPRPVTLTQGHSLGFLMPTSRMFPSTVGDDQSNIL